MVGTAVHFGGGNIGRGFIGELLHETGYKIVFVDVMDALIEKLTNTKSYTITEVSDDGEKTKTITNYTALNSKYQEQEVVETIANADLVTCAVGPNILKFIAPVIAKGIAFRQAGKPVAVIACENMVNGTDKLKEHITDPKNMHEEDLKELSTKAEFANSAVDRIVPAQDPNAGLNVTLETFYEWCVETKAFKNGHPEIKGVHWVDNLDPYIQRKLYTVNTAHATAAYFGHAKGKTTIHEAMEDEDTKNEVHEALEETAALIVEKFGIPKEEQQEYVNTIITRISNHHLEDACSRVGRAPLRKLGRHERFVGPASQIAESGKDVTALVRGYEMALRFQNVEDDEESVKLAQILKENSPEQVVEKVSGLESDHPLYAQLVKAVKLVQSETK